MNTTNKPANDDNAEVDVDKILNTKQSLISMLKSRTALLVLKTQIEFSKFLDKFKFLNNLRRGE